MRISPTVPVSVLAGAALYHMALNYKQTSFFANAARNLADGSSRDVILACRYGHLYKKGNLRASNNIANLDLNNSGDLEKFIQFHAGSRPCLPFNPPKPFATPMDIRAEHVVQGDYGNCSLLAILTGLADSWPEYIENMISKVADQYTTVKLFNGEGKPLEIVVFNNQLYSEPHKNIVVDMERPWPRLLAVAMEELTLMDPRINGQTTTAEGAWARDYFRAIFGKNSDDLRIFYSKFEFKENLKNDPAEFLNQYGEWMRSMNSLLNPSSVRRNEKTIAPILSITTKAGNDPLFLVDGIPANHSMSIHRFLYDPDNPETAYLEIRNAWRKDAKVFVSKPLIGPKVDRKIGEFDVHTLWHFLQGKGQITLRIDWVKRYLPESEGGGSV